MYRFLIFLIFTFIECATWNSTSQTDKDNGTSNYRFCLSTKPSQCKCHVSRNGRLHQIDETVSHGRIFIGPLIHSDDNGELVVYENATIFVTAAGKIEFLDPENHPILKSDGYEIRYLKRGQFIIPGFIDTHLHASQFPNLGLGYDISLLKWLEKYTIPLESRFRDRNFANEGYDLVVQRTLKMGTTTASYFASMFGNTSFILAEKVKLYGQRAFVGKVNMNAPQKHGYAETTKASMEDTVEFIKNVYNLESPLVQPSITPRFAVSCDMTLMKELGELARKLDLHIQTHISEQVDEVKLVRSKFQDQASYAEVYDSAKLLTNKTVLAHGVHLSDEELKIIKERGSAISHCPLSNTRLKSGFCDVRRLINAGIKVGLGTDVSGGNHASILEVIRSAIDMSIHLSMFKTESYIPLSYEEAFYLATLGGARALSIENSVGNFKTGKDFDALLIDLNSRDSRIYDSESSSAEKNLQSFLNAGDDRNIIEVYVSGKCVTKRL